MKFINTKCGFSLVELLITIGVSSFLLGGIMLATNQLLMSNQDIMGNQKLASFNSEARSILKKSDVTARPYCMSQINTLLTAVLLDQIVQQALATTPSSNEITIGTFNILNSSSLNYDDFTVKSVALAQLRLIKPHKGFYISAPSEIGFADVNKKPIVVFSISADLVTYLQPVAAIGLQKSIVRINLAIMELNSSLKLLDCGVGSLARTTAIIDFCKSLGPDFEYFVDRVKDNSELSGQCYVPIYDVSQQASGFSADGQHRATVTGYTPLRAFLCESVKEQKSTDFPFCTGLN